jgi:hypothetical protein
MRKPKRTVKAHRDPNGVIVYSLMQGDKRPRTIRRFGFGTVHRVWFNIYPYGKNAVGMTVAHGPEVKEQIAQWCK